MSISQFIENNNKLIAGIIILISVTLGITSVWNDAPIVDEIPHIGAGYSYIVKNDFRLNPEHPPLAKDLAGLSLLFIDVDQSVFQTKYWNEDINGQWNFGRSLIFSRRTNADAISRVAKAPMFLFFILSSVLIFAWAKKLYGPSAGLTALTLFAFSSTVIAHSRFVTTDMPALFGVLLSSYFFINYLQKPSEKNFWVAAAALGIAQLTKFSLFLINPFLVVIAFIYGFINYDRSKWKSGFSLLFKSILIIVVGFIIIVWPIYYLHVINYPPDLQKFHTESLLSTYGNRTLAEAVIYFSDKPIIRGLAQYGLGLLMVVQRSVGGNTTYFLGEVSRDAWRQYFPIVYFIKESLAFWTLAIIAMFFGIFQIRIKNFLNWVKKYFVELSMLLWLAIYWYTSITSNLNIGVRHLLPIYGFTYILIAGAIIKLIQNLKIPSPSAVADGRTVKNQKFYILTFTFSILIGLYIYDNVKVHPFYLTYFNQLAGGPERGHKIVVDSNLDWGQDLKRLSNWVDENNIQKIHLDYFGWSDQNYYLKDKVVWMSAGRYHSPSDFLKENPDGGHLAVSASFLMGSRGDPEKSYAWLDLLEPKTIIGNSIWVWEISP